MTSIRRLLRLHKGDAATASRPGFRPHRNRRIASAFGESAATSLFAGDCPVFQPTGRTAIAGAIGIGRRQRPRFSAPANAAGIKFLIDATSLHQSALEMTAKQRQPAMLLVRAMLPNLSRKPATPADRDRAVFNGRRLQVAFRRRSATATRLGPAADPELGRRVLEAELAKILNLGWFEQIQITANGGTILFVGE